MGTIKAAPWAVSCDLWPRINSDFEKSVYEFNRSYIKYFRLLCQSWNGKGETSEKEKCSINNSNIPGSSAAPGQLRIHKCFVFFSFAQLISTP